MENTKKIDDIEMPWLCWENKAYTTLTSPSCLLVRTPGFGTPGSPTAKVSRTAWNWSNPRQGRVCGMTSTAPPSRHGSAKNDPSRDPIKKQNKKKQLPPGSLFDFLRHFETYLWLFES